MFQDIKWTNGMSRYDKVDLAYDFLLKKEKSGELFSIQDLAQSVGWKIESCNTYLSKRWYQYVQKNGNSYAIKEISSLSKDEFRSLHSQKLQKVKMNDHSEKGRLLQKAKEFALLAVATYNNPFVMLKTHGFIVNIVIAYTALFHAIFNKKSIDCVHNDCHGNPVIFDGEPKAWELIECCDQYWKGVQTPEKANLKFLIGLRNKIEHRNLPYLDLMVSGYCQSALSNFESIIVNEFSKEHALMTNLAIAMQLTRVSLDQQTDAMRLFQKENYRAVRDYMETYNNDLNNDEIIESQKYRLRVFLIPKIGNHANSSDLAIEFVNALDLDPDELKDYNQGIALIKGVDSLYKLRPGKVVEKVREYFPDFNMSMHTQHWKQYKARPSINKPSFKGKYAGYIEGFDGYLYTKSWVDFLIEVLTKHAKV